MTYKPGQLYYDVPESDYYTDSALSNSDLKLIGESPYDWKNKTDQSTKAMEMGRAFHCYIGEREKFKQTYMKSPLIYDEDKKIFKELRRGTKAWRSLTETNKEILKHSEFRDLFWMKEALKKSANAHRLLSFEGKNEVSGWFEYMGETCRFRADRITQIGDWHICIDFKKLSTRAGKYLTQDTIERYNRTFECNQQAAFYRLGLRKILQTDKVLFVNIYVEDNPNKTTELGCAPPNCPICVPKDPRP